jgi:hypothetical protein
MGKLFDYTVFPLLLPLVLLWLLVARVLSLISPFLVAPSVLLAKRLYWAIPFIEASKGLPAGLGVVALGQFATKTRNHPWSKAGGALQGCP